MVEKLTMLKFTIIAKNLLYTS